MSVMLRITPSLKPSPEKPRALAHRRLLPALAVCSLASLFALPQVAAQVAKKPNISIGPSPLPVGPVPLPAGLHVATERYSNSRAGVNNQETALTPANIGASQFGRAFTLTLDGLMYAQPLYIQNLPITNPSTGQTTTHNVVFAATNNNSVYAFDADSNTGSNSGPLWHINFNIAGINGTPTSGNDVTTVFGFPQADVQPLIGITGTPVIDESTGIMYVVARTTEGTNYVHRLHAIDIRTGQERVDSPALVGQYQNPISGAILPITAPGNGDDRDGNGNVLFDLLNQNQRPALTLVNGIVYVAYGAFDNSPPYHGWVFGYSTSGLLSKPSIFCTSPNASTGAGFFPIPTQGGVDMSGAGPASDGSGLYFTTGLGTFNANRLVNRRQGTEYGESVLKLGLTPPTSSGLLTVQDYFTPFDHDQLTQFSLDLGTGGIALLPDNAIAADPLTGARPAMITAGMDGKIYILNRAGLGGLQNMNAGAISTIPNNSNPSYPLLGSNYGAPTVFTDNSGATAQVRVFFHAAGDAVRGFNMIATYPYLDVVNVAYGSANPDPNAVNPPPINFDFPGAQTVISANNGTNGVLWEVEGVLPTSPDPSQGFLNQDKFAVLHAYNVSPIRDANGTITTQTLTELFNSNQKGGGINSIGTYTKFSQPMVAGGKVFVPAAAPVLFDPGGNTSFPQGRLVVFGPVSAKQGSTGQGMRYQLSGPVGWVALSSDGANPVGPQVGQIEINRATYFSLTALDANNQASPITGTVNLSLTEVGTGRQLSLGSVSFNNQSYVVFTKTITTPGLYVMKAQDSNGNTSQNYPNFAFGIGDIPYIQAVGTVVTGFDRFTLRAPTTVRSGQLTNVTVTPVTASGFPTTVPPGTFVTIYDTLPNGGQDFSLPSDPDPTDGFGFPNQPPYELITPTPPYPTFHSQAPLSTLNFAYEMQYGLADFALTPGYPIGIYDQGGTLGSRYPNPNGTGTYPCVFTGVGQHIIIVRDSVFGLLTTGVVNVTQ